MSYYHAPREPGTRFVDDTNRWRLQRMLDRPGRPRAVFSGPAGGLPPHWQLLEIRTSRYGEASASASIRAHSLPELFACLGEERGSR